MNFVEFLDQWGTAYILINLDKIKAVWQFQDTKTKFYFGPEDSIVCFENFDTVKEILQTKPEEEKNGN